MIRGENTLKLFEILTKNATAAKKYIDKVLEKKQDKLTFDTTPTVNSSNPVTSDGIKKYVDSALTALVDADDKSY